MQKKRYPGVRPFETADKEMFFGRSHDVEDLSVLVALEKSVVLFGKSGYGKSSLINAGLIPKLTELEDEESPVIIPLVVRLGSFMEGTIVSPIQSLLTRLEEKMPLNPAGSFLIQYISDESLWYHFKRRSTSAFKFLLIFDQFEEFFTFPKIQQEDFKMQLAELLYQDMPQKIREVKTGLDVIQRRFLSEQMEIKVLFAIRSDRLSLLDSLKDKLPAILHKRYELKGLHETQALEAIELPAQKKGDFDTPPFTYSLDALGLMLKKLTKSRQQTQSTGIEAFQLQILCEYLEEEVANGRVPLNRIEPEHFADKIDDIYEGYYQRLLNKLPENTAKAAQYLIEESLVFIDEKTNESRRLSVDADVLVQLYTNQGITHEILEALEDTFLLRREVNSVGGFSYEVSHDTLLGAVLRQKEERKEAEKKQSVIAHERERRKKEIKQRWRLIWLTALTILGFALALFAWTKSVQAKTAQMQAEEARNEALIAKKKAEELLKKIQDAQDLSNAREYENRGDSYFNLGKYEEALKNYELAIEIIPKEENDDKIRERIEICRIKLKK